MVQACTLPIRLDLLELKLQAIVSPLTWLLGTKLTLWKRGQVL